MKNILISLIAISTISCVFAKDTTYYLNNYGDTISKVLIENKHTQNKNDQESIKAVLDYNKLSWQNARYLPVGFKFYIQGLDEDSVVIIDENGAKYRIELGLFHHSINRGSTEVYSNLSQYILLNTTYNNLYLNFRFDNTLYSKDDNQNISKDSTQLMFDLALGKVFEANDIKFGLGAIYKSILSYDINTVNEVSLDRGSSLGANLFIQRDFIVSSSYTMTPELNISRQLTSSSIKGLTSFELALVNQIAALGSKFDIAMRYEHTFFSLEGSSLSAQKATLGLGYKF